jgi:bifunctional non-homologous end joining protein LigD
MLAQKIPDALPPDFFLDHSEWTVEQKLDGERLLIEVKDREPQGINRDGKKTTIPTSIAANFDSKAFDGHWVFDGEILGETYYVFDVVEASAINEDGTETPFIHRKLPHQERFIFLRDVVKRWKPTNINLVPNADGEGKRTFYYACLDANTEGVVFKSKKGAYEPGKRSGNTLKCKFVDTAEVVVTELNREGKELAVGTGVFHDGKMVDAGGCKIPEEMVGKIKEGDVIEVRYLYATPSHKLYQPSWVKPRPDKKVTDCHTTQFKYASKKAIEDESF